MVLRQDSNPWPINHNSDALLIMSARHLLHIIHCGSIKCSSHLSWHFSFCVNALYFFDEHRRLLKQVLDMPISFPLITSSVITSTVPHHWVIIFIRYLVGKCPALVLTSLLTGMAWRVLGLVCSSTVLLCHLPCRWDFYAISVALHFESLENKREVDV